MTSANIRKIKAETLVKFFTKNVLKMNRLYILVMTLLLVTAITIIIILFSHLTVNDFNVLLRQFTKCR